MKSKKENLSTPYDPEINEQDLQALGKKGLSINQKDDRLLQKRDKKIDFSGKDLDVPGRNTINLTSSQGVKDEENKLYAQGSERNENLEAPERANFDKNS
ncbi:hypothetical protein [Costertonia aggregata]|uniref:Uncharacterized protein n=1 Tax=Costertonia aggregata TaxID=343403 RepID=A0A7H9ANB5_9FLAO|nr:hypothetical protein [Costertonia aggregata]QLG44951.1 hypothetical protein HYG79_06155 [Costertonia aggregata]